MSYDVYLEPPPGTGQSVDVGNSTSNHVPAWRVALGFPLAELEGRIAGDCAPALWSAAQLIRKSPDRFDELVRGDGSWGTWETAAEFLERFARACDKYPKALVEISR